MNSILLTDGYKLSHHQQYPELIDENAFYIEIDY